jgi:formylglycine-generating enzyme required for sulfatase activity
MSQRPASWAAAKARIAASPKKDFATRFRLAGFDPARDARYADWADIDFAGSDLAGFDFTGATLYLAKFRGAKIKGARFEQALLDAVIHDRRTTNPGDLISGPHAPAHLEGAALLRDAEDWKAFADPSAWRLADRPPSDAYLTTGAIFQDAPFSPEMVVVPSGTYLQGDETKPVDGVNRRPVTIAHRLAVGRFPVTFEEWDACVDDNGTKHKPKTEWERGRQPAHSVSWDDITKDYLPWLNKRLGLSGARAHRLLSEAEWEYCCRAGTETAYSFGDTITKAQAQFSEGTSGNAKQTVAVGSFAPNAWGLHDMHGNVWEWCQDIFHDSYRNAPDDGSAREDATASKDKAVPRILRGGDWDDLPQHLRSALRLKLQPDGWLGGVGFRLARTLNP